VPRRSTAGFISAWFAVALLVLTLASPAFAGVAGEGMHKTIGAKRTKTAPTIDGKLTEAAWANAPGDDRFSQSFPTDGAKPSMRTELKLLYDSEALYIGITAFDNTPNKIIARTARRDNRVDSDAFTIVLDTRHDHDSGYQFWINAAGVLADGQMHDDNRLNSSWNGVWYGKASVHAHGWSAELKIPYAILRFSNRSKQTWGINVTRYVTRTKETMQWVRIPRIEAGVLSRAGHITGVQGVEPPRTFELRPFAVTRIKSVLPGGGGLGIGDNASRTPAIAGGVNFKYGITPNLIVDTTVLPDFGQVEADPRFLNLSTFEVRLPERRPFFVENSDLFNTDVKMFYSRRIGERPSGLSEGSSVTTASGDSATVQDTPLAVPIWAAARVTGKLSRKLTIALLNAVTGPETLDVRTEDGADETIEPTPHRNYAAARAKYSFGGSSYLGFMGTGLTRSGQVDRASRNHDAYAESIDGRWVRSDGMFRMYFQFAATQRVGGPTYYEASDADGNPCAAATCTQLSRADGSLQAPGDFGYGGEMGGAKAGGTWRFFTNYSFRSPRFDVNDVGFETEWNYHRGYLNLAYRRQKPLWMFQTLNVDVNTLVRYGFDGVRRDGYTELKLSGLFHNFWTQSVTLRTRAPKTFTPRETSDGALYERVSVVEAEMSVGTDSRKQLIASANGAIKRATNDEMWIMSASAALNLRTTKRLQLSVNLGYSSTNDDLRFYSCTDASGRACSLLSQRRSYLFSRLDSSTLSLTTRATWAMSPVMSIEAYAQMFAARGRYHDAHTIDNVLGSEPYLRRVEIFPNSSDNGLIEDNNFSFNSLNVNLLWRWEFKPGNTIIAVYTRATDAARSRPSLTFRGLAHARTQEVALLKLSLLFQ